MIFNKQTNKKIVNEVSEILFENPGILSFYSNWKYEAEALQLCLKCGETIRHRP